MGKRHQSGKLNHEATRRRKKNVGGERSATDRHNMSSIVIGETLTTGMTYMIDTGIIMDGTRDTTGITPPVTTHEGRITVSTTTSPVKVTDTKRISTRNVISQKGRPPTGTKKGRSKHPTGPEPSTYYRTTTRGRNKYRIQQHSEGVLLLLPARRTL